jgi:NADPH2:quinone reductase
MRAVRVHERKPVFEGDLDVPNPRDGEVLVEMEAACISHLDLQICRGEFPHSPRRPYVLGADAAGRVVGGDRLPSGTRVWLRGGGVGVTRDGCCAEVAAVPLEAAHELREDIDAVRAATFFVPFAAARAALHEVGQLRRGERVAVRGAAGSVGQIVVQMALADGATDVIGIVGTPERAASVPAGARAVAAGSEDHLVSELAGADVDLVVDTVGGPGLRALLKAVRPRGRIVLVGYAGGTELSLDATELLVHDVSILPLNGLSREPEVIALVDDWLDALVRDQLTLPTRAFPVEDVAAAVEALSRRPSPGRVALTF